MSLERNKLTQSSEFSSELKLTELGDRLSSDSFKQNVVDVRAYCRFELEVIADGC